MSRFLAVFLIVAVVVLGSPNRTAAAGRAIERVWRPTLRLLRRRPPDRSLADRMVIQRAESLALLQGIWIRSLAAIVFVTVTRVALFVMCIRFVGVPESALSWVAVFCVWAIVRGLTVIPLMPGGAGVSELAYVAMLTPIAGTQYVNQVTAGVLVYRLLMRRVQRGEVFTQIFATVGLFFFVQNGVVALFTSDYRFIEKSFLTGLSGANLTVGGLRVGIPLLVGGLIALALFLLLYLLIDRTDFGLAMQATAEDRDAAMLVGIRPQRMYAVAWGLGTALVAIAGVILANFFSVYPQAGLSFTVLAYAIVALGGFGSILGTLMASLVVGVVQSVTAAYLPPAFKDAFVFASYILIGLFRPQGLFGRF